ncbi:MAG: SDR family oxidoreductase [Acidimicrobiales bacterium]|nr:SDR family oxidoreductase [Actinomycetota bacterium]
MSVDEPALSGKVAIVTGSTSGIGAAIARHFARHGAGIVLNSVRSVEAGEALAAELPDAVYVQGSIAEPGVPQRLVDAALERWGRLDVLVNNAGTTRSIPHHDLEAASLDVWREIFETNVFGTWEMTRVAAPHLTEQQGSVVMVTSLAGVRPVGSSVPYASSKAALNHLTALLANALGPGLRVNAVAPGLVDTPWTADWDALHEAVGAMAPMRRSAVPDDLVDVALVLATNTYLTGQVIVVDGGFGLR